MMNNKITMIEIFAGIGAQERAIRQLPIQNEIVATMDVDKDAILSYASIRYDFEKELNAYNFPTKAQMVNELQQKNVGFDFQKNKHTITMKTNENKVKQYYLADKLARNLGDVSLCEKLPYSDIVFHSSPCQDYSFAGKGAGGDEGSGTRSSLMFESLRLIGTSKPKYVIWENVSAVLSGKHRHNFIRMLEKLSEMGYESTFDLLNSKHFGVPQNRLRIFCVSHLIEGDEKKASITHKSTNKQVNETMKEISNNPNIKIWDSFIWPEEIPLATRLKDVLEKNVDEKYYLPDDRIEKNLNSSFMQEKKRIQTTDVCDTLLARDWKDPKCVLVEDINVIGNYMPSNHDASRVVDINDVAPCVEGEKIIVDSEPQVKKVGQASTEGSQCGNVYSTDDLAPTLIAGCHGYAMGYIAEEQPMKERFFKQAYETLHNNDVEDGDTIDAFNQKVNKTGISPTITTRPEGFKTAILVAEEQEPFIVASRGRNPDNPSDRTKGSPTEQRLEPNFSGCTNTLTSVQKDNYVCEPTAIIEDAFPGSRDARIYKDYSPTLRSNCGGLKVAKGDAEPVPELVGGIGEKNFGKQYRQGNRVYSSESIAMALNAQPVGNTGGYSYLYAVAEEIRWRVRKLTAKECWRLMGFTDLDVDRASQYVSTSALYKQAGNSICTCCLVAIFSSLLLEDGYKADIWSKYLINFNT